MIKFIVFLIFLSLIIFSLVSSYSGETLELQKGKNVVEFNSTEEFYVSTLVKINPLIETVSYRENGDTVGYVNLFGGIGEDFIIEKNREYEIIIRKTTSLILPEGG